MLKGRFKKFNCSKKKLLFCFYEMFVLKVVRNFLKLFWNCFLVENFRWTFSRAEGWLALPQPEGACAAPTKGCLALPQPKGGIRWQNLMKIAGNCWKLMEIDGNCWKLSKIDENLDEKFSRPESCSKFSNRFFELFPPGKFYKKRQ